MCPNELTEYAIWLKKAIRTNPPHSRPSQLATAIRDREPEEDPDGHRAVDEDDEGVLEQPLAVALALGGRAAQDPAEVRVNEPVQRAVRVSLAVREGVVLAMVRDPLDAAALAGHRPEDDQRRLHRRPALEAPVAEVSVEPGRTQTRWRS